jgi:hypothetical protein
MGLADALIPGVASNASNLVARKQFKYKEFTASGNFVIGSGGDATSANTLFTVFLVGGGGGGGGMAAASTVVVAGSASFMSGGGGGGGRARQLTLTGVAMLGGGSAGTVSVTIGAGGAGGGTANGGTAAVGGDSSLGSFVSTGGGSGGGYDSAFTAISAVGKWSRGGLGSENDGAFSSNSISGGGGGGGGAQNTSAVDANFVNGRRPANTNVTARYNLVASIPSISSLNAQWAGGGQAGSAIASGSATFLTAGGGGGIGVNGYGGGGQGGCAGTAITIADLIIGGGGLNTGSTETELDWPDGGGKGAQVTGTATAVTRLPTSARVNSGGGGGGGAVCNIAGVANSTAINAGNGADGYCFIGWWE